MPLPVRVDDHARGREASSIRPRAAKAQALAGEERAGEKSPTFVIEDGGVATELDCELSSISLQRHADALAEHHHCVDDSSFDGQRGSRILGQPVDVILDENHRPEQDPPVVIDERAVHIDVHDDVMRVSGPDLYRLLQVEFYLRRRLGTTRLDVQGLAGVTVFCGR